MSSDGVEKQVLDQWIRGGDPDQILQRIETGLQAMEETGCADDVTVLIAVSASADAGFSHFGLQNRKKA